MASIEFAPTRPSLRQRFADFMEQVHIARVRQATIRQTDRELSAMTDRELADIGLTRHNIADVARNAANTAS
ncbi:DUF1127 domain-containing protein [Tranquillimonas rosea]|uniref:DUF1127 domain-containing protein n=1 Tax=Tranquillimonas rosea TaxID=641238 RepID=UPI003BAB342A